MRSTMASTLLVVLIAFAGYDTIREVESRRIAVHGRVGAKIRENPTAGYDLAIIDNSGELLVTTYVPEDANAIDLGTINRLVLKALQEKQILGHAANVGSFSTQTFVKHREANGTSGEPKLAVDEEVLTRLLQKPGASLQAVVAIKSEEMFDARLGKFMRKARTQGATDEEVDELSSTLKQKGIFQEGQLPDFDIDSLPMETSSRVKNLVQQETKDVLVEEASKSRPMSLGPKDEPEKGPNKIPVGSLAAALSNPSDPAAVLEAGAEMIEYVQAEIADRKRERDAILEKLKNEVGEARQDVVAEAQKNLAKVNAQLDKVQLQELSLNLNRGKDAVSSVLAGEMGRDAIGAQLSVEQLIARNGVFRGVLLQKNIPGRFWPHNEVARFTKEFTDKTKGLMDERLLLNAPDSTMHFSRETSSASAIQLFRRTISQFGTSAADSTYTEAGGMMFGMTYAASTQNTDASASEGSSGQDFTNTEQLQKYYKLTEYLEPKALLKVDLNHVEPQSHLRKWISALAQSVHDRPKPERRVKWINGAPHGSGEDDSLEKNASAILEEYGSHFCPNALLGGRWEIRATFTGKKGVSTACMSEATSDATSKVFETAGSVSDLFGTASSSGGHRSESSENSQSGENKCEGKDSEGSHTDVEQEWFGGTTGAPVAEWRRSLEPAMNTNWKVLDRYILECVPIWNLLQADLYDQRGKWGGVDEVRDADQVLEALCKAWKKNYWNITIGAEESCMGIGQSEHFTETKMACDNEPSLRCGKGYESKPGAFYSYGSDKRSSCCMRVTTTTTTTTPPYGINYLYLTDDFSHCPRGDFVSHSSNLNGDLNQDAGGRDIKLCVEKARGRDLITDLTLTQSSCPYGYSKANHASSLNGDLNQKAGGKDIYLCYRKGSNSPIKELLLDTNSNCPGGYSKVAGGGLNGDLNQGAGGKDIFICYA